MLPTSLSTPYISAGAKVIALTGPRDCPLARGVLAVSTSSFGSLTVTAWVAGALEAPGSSVTVSETDDSPTLRPNDSSSSSNAGSKVSIESAIVAVTIDIIAMLSDRTRGNLTSEEAKLVEHLLYDLRLKFVAAKKSAAS